MNAPVPATALERPQWACQLHRAPSNGTSWVTSDSGYRTCEGCLIKLRDVISDVRKMYRRLDATPGANAEAGDIRQSGFESKPAASPHIVSMKDVRSKTYEVAVDGRIYEGWERDPENGWIIKPLPPGVEGPWEVGSCTDIREVWWAADGRGHSEQGRPPRSIPKALASLAGMIAEDWEREAPTGTVDQLCHWLDVAMEYCTRQDWIRDVDEELRSLRAQLKPVTGEGRKHRILSCPNVIDEGEHSRVCKNNLYEPDKHGVIRCHACKREWPNDKWQGIGPEYLSQIAVDERRLLAG